MNLRRSFSKHTIQRHLHNLTLDTPLEGSNFEIPIGSVSDIPELSVRPLSFQTSKYPPGVEGYMLRRRDDF